MGRLEMSFVMKKQFPRVHTVYLVINRISHLAFNGFPSPKYNVHAIAEICNVKPPTVELKMKNGFEFAHKRTGLG